MKTIPLIRRAVCPQNLKEDTIIKTIKTDQPSTVQRTTRFAIIFLLAFLVSLPSLKGQTDDRNAPKDNLAITDTQDLSTDLGVTLSPFPTPDPVTDEEYGCHYIRNYNWNYGGDGVGLVRGKIRYPSATCDSSDGPPADRPVLIFMHGNAMDLNDHNYLMAHLARNGFVTATITNGGDNEERARQAISYLNSMFNFWGWSHRLSGKVAFAGHSRGGEAAITAARLLSEQPSLAHINYSVRSVISIAPTDGGGQSINNPQEHLDGRMTRSFLGLYGSRDGDVIGNPIVNPVTGPEKTIFSIYDRAGTEGSVELIFLSHPNIVKSLKYAYGATHRGFKGGGGFSSGSVGWQNDMAKGYFNAFLRWHVLGQNAYKAYFDGSIEPESVWENETELYTQFSDTFRRVIDNFENGNWKETSRGGKVSRGAGIVQIAEDNLWQLDPSVPHETSGMRIKWNDITLPFVGFQIPDEQVPLVGPARDVSGFNVLSVRAAQDYNDALNTPGEDQDFYLRLLSTGGWSSLVRVSDYGVIPYPDPFVLTGPGPILTLDGAFVEPGDYTKTAMSTIRVPLEAFKNVDLTNVRSVGLYFSVPGHEIGSVIVDSLEFSR